MKQRLVPVLFILTALVSFCFDASADEGLDSVTTLESIERLNPHLSRDDPRELPLKIRTLRRDEYFFFRGTADLFLLWAKVQGRDWFGNAQTTVLLHGDVHLGNVGSFQTIGERSVDLGFGLVDPDEVFEGPFQLDLLRAATALRMAVAANKLTVTEEAFATAITQMTIAYQEAFHGSGGRLETTDDFVSGFVKSARRAGLSEYITKYVETKTEPRFRRCRMKGGRPADVMEPLDEAQRSRVVSALWSSFRAAEERATAVFGATTERECAAAVRDAVRWTRTESSGSQGLHKYLVLWARPVAGDGEELLILELKEQPAPAAVRAGLVKGVGPVGRAAEVASGCRTLCEPDPWFVSHTRFDDREFLVRLRDPWADELSDDMLRKPEDVVRFALLLGRVIGEAHEQALRPRPDADARRSAIRSAVDQLDGALAARSREAERFLRDSYATLAADDRARMYVDRVETFLMTACDR